MWLLSIFPNFLPHVILIGGILLFIAANFASLVPGFIQYKQLAKIIAGILIVLGIYLEGGLAYKKKIDLEVADLRVELAKAQALSNSKNIEIVTQVLTKTKVIREKGNDVIRYIETNKERIDNACEIPQDVIDAHNDAASLNFDRKEEGKPTNLLPPSMNE